MKIFLFSLVLSLKLLATAEPPELNKVITAYKAVESYTQTTPPLDIPHLRKLVQTTWEEAHLLYKDNSVEQSTRIRAYREFATGACFLAMPHDEARMKDLYREMLLEAPLLFPGTDHAAQSECSYWLNEHPEDAVLITTVAMLVKKYPGNERPMELLRLRAFEKRFKKSLSAAKDFLDEALKTFPGETRLISLKDSYDIFGKPVELTGTTVDGKPFDIKSWKGKVVLIDFWATWCGPCRAMTPEIKKLYDDYHDKGFEIVGVSQDRETKALTDYVAKEGLPWPQLYSVRPKESKELADRFGVIGIPWFFFVSKEGMLLDTGFRPDLSKTVEAELAK